MRQVAGRKERKWRHFLTSPFVLKPGEPLGPRLAPPSLVRTATPTTGDWTSDCSAPIRRLSGRRIQNRVSPPRALVVLTQEDRFPSGFANAGEKKSNIFFKEWAEKLWEDVMSDKGNRSGSKPLRPLIVSGKELKIFKLNLEKYS